MNIKPIFTGVGKKIGGGLLVVMILVSGYIFRTQIGEVLNKTGALRLLRSAKIIKPDTPDFFEAIETQNLIYDYNNDGVVNGSDYPAMLDAAGLKMPEPEVTEAVAESDTTSGAAGAGNVVLPSITGFSTDNYSGSVTAGFGFDLPLGTAGLTPSLSLSYSSGGVDDMYTGTETKWRNDLNYPYQQQAGIFGLGWNLGGMGQITRDTSGTLNKMTDDNFILSYEGGTARLTIETGDDLYSVWRTVPNLKLKVERFGAYKTYNNKNYFRYHWQVTAPDGTKYIFGSTPVTSWKTPNDPDTSYTSFTDNWYPLYNGNDNQYLIGYTPWQIYSGDDGSLHAMVYAWPLSKVQSVYHSPTRDVQIIYSYLFETGGYKEKYYVRSVYPKEITYGLNKVTFLREGRFDYMVCRQDKGITVSEQPMYAQNRISGINITSSGKPVMNYNFEYKYGWEPGKHTDDGDKIPESMSEIKSCQVIHTLLNKITPWVSE